MIKKIITFLILTFGIFSFYNSFVNAGTSLKDDLFQDAVNKNFKDIDKRAELFLENLNRSKNYCFGPERQMTFVECTDLIEKVYSINSEQFVLGENGYAKACEKSLKETIDKQKDKAISTTESKTILDKDGYFGSCTKLYQFKLSVFKSVAYDILKKNKYAILRDEHKKYTQKSRVKHDYLTELFRVSLGYIERLWQKWPSKTKK